MMNCLLKFKKFRYKSNAVYYKNYKRLLNAKLNLVIVF